MATYLVGDIQGCYDPLARLLDKINFDPAADYIWSCGDLVNRGGKSRKVLRLLHSIETRVSVTLGNHDLYLLAADARYANGKSPNKEFRKILQGDDRRELISWLKRQPLAAWSEEHQLLRLHAGVIPQWDLETVMTCAREVSDTINSPEATRFFKKMGGRRPSRWKDSMTGMKRLRLITNILTQTRFCREDGKLDLHSSGPPSNGKGKFKAWFRHKNRRTRDIRIAFGHWAALGFREKNRYIALDSGCVWGGKLTAWHLEESRAIQVKSRA